MKIRLDPLGAGRNAQTRRAWAVRKAQAIARRKDEIASGALRATGTALQEAIGRYYADHPRLRPRTAQTYTRATDRFVEWCTKRGLRSADKLNLPQLVAYRSWLAGAPRQRPVKAGKRGARIATERQRAPTTVNVEIRSIKVVLNYLRRLGLLPLLSRDDIADGLKVLRTEKPAPEFLRPRELAALLRAALDHDAETFEATREEHAGWAERGSTARYPSISPLMATAMLTGMRFGELAALDWSEVDLEHGKIRLGARTKTKHARDIEVDEVSPALAKLLAALGPKQKGSVWGLTAEQIRAAGKRLARYGAPTGWSFQGLRRTCGTYLTNAPGVFGAASAYRSARQLGHSVTIAERHYLGVIKVPKDAATLEAAMQIEGELGELLQREQ